MRQGGAGGSALIGQDLGVNDSRCVIDRDVYEFPPGAVDGVAPVSGYPMADADDSREFLDTAFTRESHLYPVRTLMLACAAA